MLRKTVVARSLALAFGLGVSSVAMLPTAYAQTNTTGNVFGQVAPAPGQTVQIENPATGFKRVLTPDASGRFSASSLPTGVYKAVLMRDGKVVGTSQEVEVKIGQGSEVAFSSSSGTQVVQVTGRLARLDVSSTNNGASFTAKQLESLPIARNVDAIIQLAPNTTRADPRYSGGASFGGGAPSENSYYINGFPVTNPLNQLGAAELPFGAIAQAQVLTGGFGAEFGRSIGGVVSINTKSGTNTWEGGLSMSAAPNSLRSTPKDIMYPDTGAKENAATDGKLYRRYSDGSASVTSLGGYVGGPLIKDQLFMFVAVEQIKDDRSSTGVSTASAGNGFSAGTWSDRKNTTDRYLAKFDWNPVRNHLFEATLIGDKYTQNETLSGYNYTTGERNGVPVSSATFINQPDHNLGVGGTSQILRYTGFLTDDLTVSALVGKMKTPHTNAYAGVDVYSKVPQVRADPSTQYPGFTYNSPYPFAPGTTVLGPGSEDQVKASRLDVEYKLGDHKLRGGVDQVKLQSTNAGEIEAGGSLVRYFRTTNAGLKPNGATTGVQAGGALSANVGGSTYYYYGYEQVFTTITSAASNQSAFYLEDVWQVSKNLIVTPGLRIEKYDNVNGDGDSFLKVKTQLHPRLAFAWDTNGDASMKLFGSAGRYGVQIPTHLAVRGASRSTFTRQPFIYTGVDAQGLPTGRVNIGTPNSSNNEYGQAKDPNTVAALDMKPNSQDELTLGIEKALNPQLNVGARVTYRKLAATIDDLCDPRPFEAYAARNKINTDNWGGFGCASFNPGMANTFLIDYAGTGKYTTVQLSKDDLGFDTAKRTYFALDLFAEHPFSNGWYGRVNYTYSKNKGNTEGQTLSDVAQTDVAATQTWDHPELMQGAYGYLPNDRRHQIKAYGFVRVMPELDVGANLLIASGRPKNCIGNFGGTESAFPGASTTFGDVDYGSSYRFCTVNGVTSSAARGTSGNLPMDQRLDMNLVYKPDMVKGLALRLDVFNLFNKQTIQAIDEVHENAYDPSTTTPTYGRVISYTAPRTVKFTVTYDRKF